jgi:hydroxymethylglutaryl-CoA lyase
MMMTMKRLMSSMATNQVFAELPKSVRVVEVGPRDGLQNEKRVLPLHVKVELVDRLQLCGSKDVEVTSFVAPSAVPQMADAVQVYKAVCKQDKSVRRPCLTPNIRGLRDALAVGVTEVAIFGAVSSSFSKANINCTTEESLERYVDVIDEARANGATWIRGYVSTVLGCPYEGRVDADHAADVVRRFWDLGVDEIALGDTIGIGTPGTTRALLCAVAERGVPIEHTAVHFHDTYGQALANILTSLQHGIVIVDSSIAGLGGCPYALAATGNVATEDVVFMLEGLGIETGLSLDRLIETGEWISTYLGKRTRSKVSQARSRFIKRVGRKV